MSTLPRPVAPRPVVVLPQLLFRPERPALYIAAGVGASLVGAVALSALASHLAPGLEGPSFPMDGWLFLFLVAVFSPVLETAIMAVVIEALRRFFAPWAVVALSAAGWALAHSSAAPAWGLVIWWPFTIFSLAYLVWREKGWWKAYLVATTIHAIQNAAVAVPMAFS